MRQSLITNFRKISEAAAIEASRWNGRFDAEACNRGAASAMRQGFGSMNMSAQVVVGQIECEDEHTSTNLDTPIAAGEILGRGGDSLSIGIDPVEGTHLCANNQPNALTAIAFAPRETLAHVPDVGYMRKLAVGPEVDSSLVSIDKTPKENIEMVARCKDVAVEDVVVCVLDRPRHRQLIRAVHDAGARVRLIYDGDIQAAIAAAMAGTNIDMYMGDGGAPEGLLAAAALKAMGGFFQARYVNLDEAGRHLIQDSTSFDPDQVITMDQLVSTRDIHFVATGITDGEMLQGVKRTREGALVTHSVVLSAIENTTTFVNTIYRTGKLGWDQAEPGINDSVF